MIQIQVTEAHLDKAIQAINNPENKRCSVCIITQAISDYLQKPVKTIRASYTHPEDLWRKSKDINGAGEAMDLFDHKRFEELRAMLPIIIEIEE